jgi:integrase
MAQSFKKQRKGRVMALEFRFYKGELSKHFFGRSVTDGKVKVYSLSTPIEGIPPVKNGRPSLHGVGDTKFEISRATAEAELKDRAAEDKQKGRADHLTARLIKSKTGVSVEYVKLADLATRWRKLSRETAPSEAWLKWCDTIFTRFAEATPKTFLHEVTQEHAAEYGQTLRKKFTRRTASGAVSLLKSAFARLLPVGVVNPFEASITRKGGSDKGGEAIHRRPLTAEELKTLFEAARPDPLLYPLTVCAACTGMRIGDVCQLQWKSVDTKAGIIGVKTAKTGSKVEIPLFKPLQEVLEAALAEKGGSQYVWPRAATMYQKNRYGITYRGKALFARAFAKAESMSVDVSESGTVEGGKADLAEILPKVLEAVRGAGFAQGKQDRIIDSLTRVASGQSYRSIEAETGRKHAIVSQDLKDAEDVSEFKFRKGKTEASGRDLKTLIKDTRQSRGKGKKMLSASLLGWHSLRGTFATLALSAGIPIETVKLVTGHGTVATITKYYYNPQREHLRTVLGDKLPEVLTGKSKQKPAKKIKGDRIQEIAKAFGDLSDEEKFQLARMLEPQKVTVKALPAKQ